MDNISRSVISTENEGFINHEYSSNWNELSDNLVKLRRITLILNLKPAILVHINKIEMTTKTNISIQLYVLASVEDLILSWYTMVSE